MASAPKAFIVGLCITVGIVIAAAIAAYSIYSEDAGETAIITCYGEIIDTKTSGLNWKSPVEDVTYFITREAKIDFGSFDKDTGDVISGLSAYTSDCQTATVALTLTCQGRTLLRVLSDLIIIINIVFLIYWLKQV